MNQTDENHIIAILTQAFHDNKSTNFVIKQDKKKQRDLEPSLNIPFFTVSISERYFYQTIKQHATSHLIQPKRKQL